jgi:NAD(P) transhydrogenase subunit beta
MKDFSLLINAVYVVSAILFIFGLKLLSHPSSARKGNLLSALAMFVAVVVTLLEQDIISFDVIVASIVIGISVNCQLCRITDRRYYFFR